MSTWMVLGLILAHASAALEPETFAVASSHGHVVHGQADHPAATPRGAVILVAGTGAFDRDVRLGASGTSRDAVFADLARRISSRGMSAVRYDRRGVLYGSQVVERAAITHVTAEALSDDLQAVHDWLSLKPGAQGRCIVFLVHSEGIAHLAELARRRLAPTPKLIIGMGAPLMSKADGLHWQYVERDRASLELMDADGDGVVTNAEVEAGWRDTPVAVFNRPDLLVQPDGGWSPEDLETLSANQKAAYEAARTAALSARDTDPFPNALAPAYSMAWWKSWFTDERSIGEAFIEWGAPLALHYGALDSQLSVPAQRQAAAEMGTTVREFVVHNNLGHTLGPHGLLGPMDEAVADTLAQKAADACR